MSYSPVSGADADEFVQEFFRLMRTARKPHRCGECHDEIAPGQRYEDVAGMLQRELFTFKTCGPCVEIRNHFSDGTWLYGGLWEAIQGCFQGMPLERNQLDGLGSAATEKILDEWRRWGTL